MSIIDRARIELEAINFGEEDSAVMIEILGKFFKQWDSGGAVAVVAPLLMRLIDGKPLSPLTGKDHEWIEVGSEDRVAMFQNKRCSTVFKKENIAWDIDRPGFRTRITFPYYPMTGFPEMPIYETGS